MAPPRSTSGSPTSHTSEFETEDYEGVVELLASMNLNVKHTHFIGRSSSMTFVRAALAVRQEYLEPDPLGREQPRDGLELHQPDFWAATAVSHTPNIIFSEIDPPLTASPPLFLFCVQRLIRPEPPHPASSFPPEPLLTSLIEHYFLFQNNAYPLLYRPQFARDLQSGLHLRDEAFGSTVLLVCAVGARFSMDPAVFPRGTRSWHWAGWQWFEKANLARRFVHVSTPRVYDLQVCAVRVFFISCRFPQCGW